MTGKQWRSADNGHGDYWRCIIFIGKYYIHINRIRQHHLDKELAIIINICHYHKTWRQKEIHTPKRLPVYNISL